MGDDAPWPAGREWARARRWAGRGVGDLVAAAAEAAGAGWSPADDAIIVARGWQEAHDPTEVSRCAAEAARSGALSGHPGDIVTLLYDELADFDYLRGLPSLAGQAVARALGGCRAAIAVTSGWDDSVAAAGRLVRTGHARRVMVCGGDGPARAQVVAAPRHRATGSADVPLAVAGVGAVTPLGADAATTVAGLEAGRSGVVGASWLAGLPVAPALGTIPDAIRRRVVDRWQTIHPDVDMPAALAHEVIDQALATAEPRPGEHGPLGLVVATMWAGPGGTDPDAWSAWFATGAHPSDTREPLAGLGAQLAGRLNRPVVSLGVEATCAGGLRALDEACRMVALGEVSEAVAVGVVVRSNPYHVSQFAQLTALSRWAGPAAEASRPFDRDRSGMVLGEGAAAVLVRPAPGGVRILGVGTSHDYAHPTAPRVDGVTDAVTRALAQAGVGPDTVDILSTHGTGTRLNDTTEDAALTALLGRRAAHVPVIACKAATGHASAASGLLEVGVLAHALTTGRTPGSPACPNPDPVLTLNPASATRRVDATVGLGTSFGFGGQYAAVVLATG